MRRETITSGQHTFTYDHVFGEGGTAPDLLYSTCIAPLVDGLFKGYNATVLAYGQTGSGKTFTMGSEYKPSGRCRGVIPDAINDIYNRIESAKDAAITVRVSFVEIHKEEIKDLLLPPGNGPRPAVTIRETPNGDVALYGAVEREVRTREEMAEVLEMGTLCRSTASTSMNNRSSRSHAIFSIMLEQRRQVQASAATPNTDTASMQGGDEDGDEDEEVGGEEVEGVEDYLGAKMHLVDLAGSERAKRTKAEGARLREGIHINRGLLALGNVINAIVDNHKHVPYRDSKLTRLLQDSLGGNSRTVMIACVSPADSNFEESLNTLRYADRARHIKNKPTVNRDPVAAQIAVLRNTIAQLRSENVSLKRALAASGSEGAGGLLSTSAGERLGASALEAVVERLTQENSSLDGDNMRLRMEMDDLRRQLALVTDKWHTAQAQCDLMRMNNATAAHQAQQGTPGGAQDGSSPLPGVDIVKGYLERIAELENEVKSMKSLAHLSFARRRGNAREPRTPGSGTPRDGDGQGTSVPDLDNDFDPASDQQPQLAEEDEYFAEVAAQLLNEEKMKKEVAVLQRRLEEKERKMAELMKGSAMPHLKQQYDRALIEVESERDKLKAERKTLLEKLNAVSNATEEEHKRLEAQYRERIREHDEQLKQLRQKARELVKLQKLKERTEAVQRQLSAEIQRLKQSKVAMQRQLEASTKQFAAWRQDRERELAQLRKQTLRDRATIQQLEAIQAKQNAVLQRKISEGNAARKRIKEFNEINRKRAAINVAAIAQQQAAAAAAQQQALGATVEIQPNPQAPLLRTDKERREWLQKELEMCNMSFEFRKIIDGELAQRAEASRALKELEKSLTRLDQVQPASPLLQAGAVIADAPISPALASTLGASGPDMRDKIVAKRKVLEEKVAYHNAQICELQAQWERQKAEEESRGGGANDMRRWAGLRNMVEGRELLRILFRLSVESKTLCNDLTVDMVRYSEEVDVLRVQLEGAQKKCAQYRKLALALQAAAAAAHTSAVPHHGGVSAQDETDKQVDAVLEELHVVRNNTPSTAATHRTQLHGGEAVPIAGACATQAAVACGDEDVEMQDADTPGTPDAPPGGRALEPKALEFLSPVPSGVRPRQPRHETPNSSQRYSPDHDDDSSDDEDDTRDGSRRGATDRAVDSDDDDEHDEDEDAFSDEESDSDDDDDDNWDPAHATPARGRGGRSNRRASSLAPADAAGAPGSRRNSRQHSAAGAMDEDVDMEDVQPSAEHSRRQTGSRRTSSRRSSTVDEAVLSLEGPVLDHINLKRYAEGHQVRLTKLTVAVLKEALKGQIIDGQRWHAGSKNRAALIQDYRRLIGLPKTPSEEQQPAAGSSAAQRDALRATATDMSLLRCSRASSGKSTGGAVELSLGGARVPSVELPPPPMAPPTEGGKPLESNGSDGGAPSLVRSGSGSGTLAASADGAAAALRKPASATTRPEVVTLNTAATVHAATGGALRESLDYRGAILSAPLQSASPRVPRPPVQTATGATSPRSSVGTPSPQLLSQRSGGKSSGSGVWSPAGSFGKDRTAQGGENMQPGSTPRATTGGSTPGSGKGTPMTNMYKEKAARVRERVAALCVSMQRNWDDPGNGSDKLGKSLTSLAGATGAVASSVEVAGRGAGGLRDSGTGVPGAAAGQKTKAIWR
ncbi:hypothetical protein GPECTOR_76g796 [Gonium pectorale]|uniref:Kinesin motor domain-containing protein n=1 Tax=Gonium pectorale TaxID=33097 RepID=A0A150G395_GONPE|nr:hypothetical protein GPECTOR_76g796 [Gonium pectorale]|eukprot:KXZ43975.1 hypothetical protein GPECTOR_76g796 [Gonium pectorale]